MAGTLQTPHLLMERALTIPRENSHLAPIVVSNTERTIVLSQCPFNGNATILDVETNMAQVTPHHDPNARPRHFRNNFEECIFVFTVMMATAATTFLQGVIVINTAAMGRDLKMTSAQVTWIAASIGGSFMLFFGKTADLLGCKVQLVIGMSFLSVFSLTSAFAPNSISLDIFCGFLGLGTAVISPPAMGTLFASYPEGKRRNKAAGALSAGNPLGLILGSISSGIATKLFSWRASFIVIAIFFFVMAVLSIWTMPSIPRVRDTRTLLRQFDYLGTALTVVGMALFSAALTQGPDIGWKSTTVIVMLIVGVFSLISFSVWENICPYPLLNPIVWKNTNYTLCVLCTLFGYMSFVTNQFWIPLYMQEVQHLSPLHIAVRMLPQALASLLWSYIGQAMIDKIKGRTIMAIGGFGYLIGATLLIFIRPETSYWKFLFPSIVLAVIGANFQFIVSNLYVTKQMPSQSSLAAGVIQTVYRLSVSLGLAITSAVYGSVKNTLQGKIDMTLPFERAYLCGIIFAAVGLLFIPFMHLDKQGAKEMTIVPYHAGSVQEPELEKEGERRAGGEYNDIGSFERKHTLTSKPSQITLSSMATYGSGNSFFPRWSWEDEEKACLSKALSFSGTDIAYEVCIHCLEERRIILPSSNSVISVAETYPGNYVVHNQMYHDRRSWI